MTALRITANGKPHYHFATTSTMTYEEIDKHIKDNIFKVDGVEYEMTITVTSTVTETKKI